jgi:hypothetical protein
MAASPRPPTSPRLMIMAATEPTTDLHITGTSTRSQEIVFKITITAITKANRRQVNWKFAHFCRGPDRRLVWDRIRMAILSSDITVVYFVFCFY